MAQLCAPGPNYVEKDERDSNELFLTSWSENVLMFAVLKSQIRNLKHITHGNDKEGEVRNDIYKIPIPSLVHQLRIYVTKTDSSNLKQFKIETVK